MFKGKRFQDNSNQQIVTVVDENGTWINLDDNRSIKTNVFLQKFSEYIEADNFFTNDTVMENLAQQFSEKINLNTIPIVGQDGTNISFNNPSVQQSNNTAPAGYFVDDSQIDFETKKREAFEKFNNTYQQPPVIRDAIDMSQIGIPENQRVAPLQRRERPVYVPPEESETVVKDANTGQVIIQPVQKVQQATYTESKPQQDDIYKIYDQNKEQFQSQVPPRPIEQRPVEQPNPDYGYATRNEYPGTTGIPPTSVQLSPEEESFMFFRKFKKVYPVKIEVSFDEMIAEPNYVRQTAMNFEGDIIKFYTKELMKKIWSDPSILETQIYNNLKKNIMGEEKLSEVIEETMKTIEKEIQDSILFSEYCDPEKNPIDYSDYIKDSIEKPIGLDLTKEKENEDRRISMETAAKTIGLDLVEVKPTGDRIDIVTPFFKYEDGEIPPPVEILDIDDLFIEKTNEDDEV